MAYKDLTPTAQLGRTAMMGWTLFLVIALIRVLGPLETMTEGPVEPESPAWRALWAILTAVGTIYVCRTYLWAPVKAMLAEPRPPIRFWLLVVALVILTFPWAFALACIAYVAMLFEEMFVVAAILFGALQLWEWLECRAEPIAERAMQFVGLATDVQGENGKG